MLDTSLLYPRGPRGRHPLHRQGWSLLHSQMRNWHAASRQRKFWQEKDAATLEVIMESAGLLRCG